MAARREDGLDPGLGPEAEAARLGGEEPRGDHHGGVSSRGAARDGGDGDGPVTKLAHVAHVEGRGEVGATAGRGRGLEALTQAGDGHAVMRTRRTGE